MFLFNPPFPLLLTDGTAGYKHFKSFVLECLRLERKLDKESYRGAEKFSFLIDLIFVVKTLNL